MSIPVCRIIPPRSGGGIEASKKLFCPESASGEEPVSITIGPCLADRSPASQAPGPRLWRHGTRFVSGTQPPFLLQRGLPLAWEREEGRGREEEEGEGGIIQCSSALRNAMSRCAGTTLSPCSRRGSNIRKDRQLHSNYIVNAPTLFPTRK